MFILEEVKITTRGIRAVEIAKSTTPKDFAIRLKSMKTNKIDGWIIYQNDDVMAYQLPKSILFKTLDEMAQVMMVQTHLKGGK